MERAWGQIFLLLTVNTALGQKRPTQVKYTRNSNNSCGHVHLGSGFEKSGMVQYVARPKIIESKWTDGQLSIRIFVVSDCCPPDYLGYVEQADTLNLYYGKKSNLPDKDGPRKEVDVCMCGESGCCFEFEYRIKRPKRNTNYLVAVSDVIGIGRIKPYPIGYLNSKNKSVHYSKEVCDSFDVCLDDKIGEAVSNYKRLGPLYDSLIDLHKSESAEEKEMVNKIKGVWIRYFDCREAIYDQFIRSNTEHKLYTLKISEFELQILNELKLLEPRLDITNEYLHGGSFTGPIKEIKIKTTEN